MSVTDYLKNKYVIAGGLLIVSASLIAAMLRGKSSGGDIIMTAQGMGESNLAMVAAAQEFTLKQNQLNVEKEVALQGLANERYITDAGIEILRQNNAAYLTGLEATNDFNLASQVSAQDYALASQMEANALQKYFRYEDAVNAARQLDSAERIRGQELATQNSIAAAEFADRDKERAQAYNLANYQTMVQHDLGKKEIKAGTEANRLGFIGSVAKLFF